MTAEANNDMKIREIIVVEGRDDTTAVRRSVDAVTIETHGYGISAATWKLIDKAYHEKGIIVFTDPDHAGEQIRRRYRERIAPGYQGRPEQGEIHCGGIGQRIYDGRYGGGRADRTGRLRTAQEDSR